MLGNQNDHPAEELNGGRVRQWVAGASVAAALIALALFFGESLFSTTSTSDDHTASVGSPEVRASTAPLDR